jgi:hypothetical protein
MPPLRTLKAGPGTSPSSTPGPPPPGPRQRAPASPNHLRGDGTRAPSPRPAAARGRPDERLMELCKPCFLTGGAVGGHHTALVALPTVRDHVSSLALQVARSEQR